MDINLTFIVQGIAFFAVAWLVMKFGWPHIIAAIEERQRKIADGLAAADAQRFHLKISTGELAHEKLMRSIELYGTKVVPLVKDMLA